jgi:protein-arginine kinase activator protein McsA
MDDSNQLFVEDSDKGKEGGMSDVANPLSSKTIAELQELLEEALQNEDYELASRIRDEINKRQAY